MTYAIIGAGGVGGYFGAKLARAGHEVHFLLHSDYDYVAQHGLRIESVCGSFTLDQPLIYNNAADMPKCDVAVVALKTTRNKLLPELLTPLLRPDTLVLLIQNGIGVEQDVQAMLPEARLAAGLAFIGSAKTEPGVVRHQCLGNIHIAPYSCPDSNRVQALATEFREAGVEADIVEYNEARWKKALWNMPYNGMTVAHRTTTANLMADPATRKTIRKQMSEVVRAAQACGVEHISERTADKMMDLTDRMPPYDPSMKVDFDLGRPMEIYYIYTRPIEMAAAAGCAMPELKKLEQQLLQIESGAGAS